MGQDVSGAPAAPTSHSIRVELYADGKQAFKQEFVVPAGLTKKLAAQVVAQLVNNAVLKAADCTLAGLGFK